MSMHKWNALPKEKRIMLAERLKEAMERRAREKRKKERQQAFLV